MLRTCLRISGSVSKLLLCFAFKFSHFVLTPEVLLTVRHRRVPAAAAAAYAGRIQGPRWSHHPAGRVRCGRLLELGSEFHLPVSPKVQCQWKVELEASSCQCGGAFERTRTLPVNAPRRAGRATGLPVPVRVTVPAAGWVGLRLGVGPRAGRCPCRLTERIGNEAGVWGPSSPCAGLRGFMLRGGPRTRADVRATVLMSKGTCRSG